MNVKALALSAVADRTWEEVPVPDSLPPHSFAVLSF